MKFSLRSQMNSNSQNVVLVIIFIRRQVGIRHQPISDLPHFNLFNISIIFPETFPVTQWTFVFHASLTLIIIGSLRSYIRLIYIFPTSCFLSAQCVYCINKRPWLQNECTLFCVCCEREISNGVRMTGTHSSSIIY